MLSVIYINNLPQSLLKSSMACMPMIRLSTSLTPAQALRNDLNNVGQWLASSRLVLNQSKTKWMLFGTRKKLEHCSDHKIQLHGEEIDMVWSFCNLGVTLDKNLSWNQHVHVELIWNKVSKHLGLLCRIRPYFTLKAAKCVYNCLVQPIYDYSDTVWSGLSIGCSDSFQCLQNRAAHIIQRRAMAKESFKIFVWVDLETQGKAHKCILIFKCLNKLFPPYLLDYFIRIRTVHTYKTRQSTDIHLPNPKLTLGKDTFRFSSVVLFNNLPTSIKEASSLRFHFSH